MEQNYASITRRILALILDSLVLSIPVAIGSHLIPVVGGLAVYLFYGPVLECSAIQASLGKYWVGIQVTDASGGRISLKAAIIRNLIKMLMPMILFIGFFIALFSDRKQTLHDIIADTFVVYGRNQSISVADAWIASAKAVFKNDTMISK